MPSPALRRPCLHPLVREGATNRDLYAWLSQYQKALEDCNDNQEAIWQELEDKASAINMAPAESP